MAAIAGALSQGGSPAREVALALAMRMRHRSPDSVAIWDDAGIALAHGALHADTRSRGPQPLRLVDGAVLVVDGRVDDRAALCAALGLRGEDGAAADAALFGAAWLRWRQDLWRHLVGDYAMAVWEPAAARLTLLRDRVGVRPVYWTCHAGWFGFASEPQALLALPGAAPALDPEVLAAMHAPQFEIEDPARTLYAGIRRLLPGEVLAVSAGRAPRCVRPWSFAELSASGANRVDACVEEFRAVFDQAVACRVAGARKPALMLSGGIDSAGIHASALAQGLELQRMSVVAQQWNAAGELSNIEAMLARSPHASRLPVQDIDALVDAQRWARELLVRAHPVLATLALPMLVNQAAAASGCRVMLDGIDGDLALHAPGHYVGHLARAGRWELAMREARSAALHHTYLQHLPAWRIFAQSLAATLEPAWLAKSRERLQARGAGRDWHGILHPDLVARLGLRQRSLRQRLDRREQMAAGGWRGHRWRLWERVGFMRGMEGYDMAAARWGLEARHPWADLRVLEVIARMPMDLLVRDGWTKYVARKAYAPELGAVAWHSGKAHLGPQVTLRLLDIGRSHVQASLSDADVALGQWIDPGVLQRVTSEWNAGHSQIETIDTVLSLAALRAWLRQAGIA
jgi:asparagine synthase (glutamine-hydrolysing)